MNQPMKLDFVEYIIHLSQSSRELQEAKGTCGLSGLDKEQETYEQEPSSIQQDIERHRSRSRRRRLGDRVRGYAKCVQFSIWRPCSRFRILEES